MILVILLSGSIHQNTSPGYSSNLDNNDFLTSGYIYENIPNKILIYGKYGIRSCKLIRKFYLDPNRWLIVVNGQYHIIGAEDYQYKLIRYFVDNLNFYWATVLLLGYYDSETHEYYILKLTRVNIYYILFSISNF